MTKTPLLKGESLHCEGQYSLAFEVGRGEVKQQIATLVQEE